MRDSFPDNSADNMRISLQSRKYLLIIVPWYIADCQHNSMTQRLIVRTHSTRRCWASCAGGVADFETDKANEMNFLLSSNKKLIVLLATLSFPMKGYDLILGVNYTHPMLASWVELVLAHYTSLTEMIGIPLRRIYKQWIAIVEF
jgi:hypothetical protein